jgi:hypothetical protein
LPSNPAARSGASRSPVIHPAPIRADGMGSPLNPSILPFDRPRFPLLIRRDRSPEYPSTSTSCIALHCIASCIAFTVPSSPTSAAFDCSLILLSSSNGIHGWMHSPSCCRDRSGSGSSNGGDVEQSVHNFQRCCPASQDRGNWPKCLRVIVFCVVFQLQLWIPC